MFSLAVGYNLRFMEGAPFALILDVVILVLLGLTIVYAARLSIQLRRLRDSKGELDKVIRDLVRHLDRADRSIMGLKETAREAGGDLQNAIDRAIAISDELEVINDSGNRIAERLEGLVDRARPMMAGAAAVSQPAPKPVQKAEPTPAGNSDYAKHLRKLDPADEGVIRSGFAIRDADAERGIDPLEAVADDEKLYSEAERDLFRAMKGRTTKS